MKTLCCMLLFMSLGATEPEAYSPRVLYGQSESREVIPHYLEEDDYYVMRRGNTTALPESPECDACDYACVTTAAWCLLRLFLNGC